MIKYIHRLPFLRFVLPLIVGIVSGDFLFQIGANHLSVFFLLAFLFSSLLLLLLHHVVKQYQHRWVFGSLVFVAIFSAGGYSITSRLDQASYTFPGEQSSYLVTLTGAPEVKERSVLLPITVCYQLDSVAQYPIGRKAYLYLQKDTCSISLKSSDQLLVNSLFSAPNNRNGLDEFDYSHYLRRKGVAATGYADSIHWRKVAESSQMTITEQSALYRNKIIEQYKLLGFEGDNLAVLSALTLGDKGYLDDDIKEAYSIAGASHILAVSGMHIGFICTLLLFLLKWIPKRWRCAQLIKAVLIISLVWCYAFFVGSTPSAIRSACMFSFLLIGFLLLKKQESMNVFFATAFLMLLVNPAWLFDIGFQLSFMAVGSIILCNSLCGRWLANSNLATRYVGGILFMSIAAQIGVAPLVAFYFSSFSTHFLLTNLLVVPLVTLIIYTTVAMLFLFFIPALQLWIALLLKLGLDCLNGAIRWIEHLPYSSISNIWIHQLEVILLYVFICLMFLYCWRKKAKLLLISLSSLLVLCVVHFALLYQNRPSTSIVFYQLNKSPLVHCISADKQSWIVPVDTLFSEGDLPSSVISYWAKQHLDKPQLVLSDIDTPTFQVHDKMVQYYDKRICLINDNRWRSLSTTSPLYVDYLYLSRGFTGNLEELLNLFKAKQVILDSSLSSYWQTFYESECLRLGKRYLSLSDKGSIQILL